MSSALPPTIRTRAFLDGDFVDAQDAATFQTRAPATGQVIAEISACTAQDVDRAVASARATFEDGRWSRLTPDQRGEILEAFADLIQEHLEELALTESIDAGKPITDCRDADLPDVIATFRWYAQAASKVFGKVSPTGPEALGLIVREPIGVVGAVLPWNFPASMLSWKLAPALAAGNSVVVKPPELASLTTLRLAELAVEAGLPAGVFNVVPGLGEVAGRAIGLHPDVDLVTFTGSTEVGREFLRYSADSNLKEVVLEMGGKSPQIVMPSWAGQLRTVAEDLAGAAFGNNGQNCTAGSRILVHSSIQEDLLRELAAVTEAQVVGEPTEEATDLGPLIEQDALDRVLGYVEGARERGARIVTGGQRVLPETGGYFVAPTVITDLTSQDPVVKEEIFGPVVAVLPFETEEESIALADDTDYGLAATVWTKDVDQAIRMARAVRAGTVAVNGYSEGDMSTPFGGFRQSGFGGRDNGLEALEQYTQLKTIWFTVR